MTRTLVCTVLVLFAVSALAQPTPASPSTPPDAFSALHFRELGPIGNRASAIVGVPGDPMVVYIGAASGGIWKTENGGTTWKPIFDSQDVSAIGSLAIAPSRHNEVWAGTGEPWLIRPDHAMGDGIYKSTDAGRTWKHMGLELTGHIARVLVDPRNPDVVFACAVGQAYRPQHERGIFKTTDGGATWKQVLFVNENTGCSELSIDAHDPDTLFAGMWQVDIKTWGLNSGGPGGGVYVSHDGGNTWKKLSGNGLPAADAIVGKTAVQVAPSDSNRVYALIEETTPTLYRSDDGGGSWKIVNRNHILAERAPYYVRFGISPDNENLLYFMSVSYSASRDGGQTFARDMPDPSGDNHDVWIDPTNPKRVLVASDGGGSISLDGAKSWYQAVLPIAQIYHVYTDNQIPYYVYGNRQDGPSYMGPSNAMSGGGIFGGGITAGEWRSMGGCESGFGIPDPVEPNIVWSGCYDGQLDRTDMRTGQSRSVHAWPDAAYGWAPADVKRRFHWTFPISISPFDHNTVYVGSQVVHMTTDGGQSWKDISPDLTLNDKSHQRNSGGINADNLMTFDGATLFAIAESPKQKGLIWVGTNDGQVQITRDGGARWNNVTKNIPNLPAWGTVSNIEPSHFDAGTAYITVNFQQVGNYDPYVYKTADYGATWKLIVGGIPKSVSSFAHCVREDPERRGMLYLGTDNALYVSWNDGEQWTRVRSNLPPAPVYWLEIQPHFNDLVIATYGRGDYVLDDITPLRNWEKAQSAAAYLFPVRPAYRFRSRQDQRASDANSSVVGENPPYGADINFFLKTVPKQIEISILGPDNQVIRTIKPLPKEEGVGDQFAEMERQLAGPDLKPQQGLNRVWWDLREKQLTPVQLRVSPPGEPWVKPGDKGYRPLIMWTSGALPPRVTPGNYTVKLTVDGQSFTQPLRVLPDPNSLGKEQDIAAENQFLHGLVGQLNQAAEMINNLEWVRLEIQQSRDRAGASANTGMQELEQKAIAAEDQLVDVHLTGRVEDSFRHPMRLYGRMMAVLQNLGETGADLPPTAQEIEVNRIWQQQLAQAKTAYEQVMQQAKQALRGGVQP